MTVYSISGVEPTISATAYIAEEATVIGNCEIGEHATIWPNAVLRGDNDKITLGSRVNIQDGAVIHVDTGHPAHIKDGVSIAHQAMVHGATIGQNTLIGMQAVILNDAVIGRNCIIGANTVIPSGKVIPDHSMVVGTPGKIIREVTDAEIDANKRNALNYVSKGVTYKNSLKKIG
jgi:carbonic anhydrase/acetyltransferase-like protein (isoleucine patch superfamily)